VTGPYQQFPAEVCERMSEMEAGSSRPCETLVTKWSNRGLSANQNARALISMMVRSKTAPIRDRIHDARPLMPDRRNLCRRTAGP